MHRETTADGGTRTVWLLFSRGGGVSVCGQDLGDLSGFFGTGVREYEWAHSVTGSDIPALVHALGGAVDADVVALMMVRFSGVRHGEFAGFCTRHRIPVEFWSRFGE